MTQVGLHIPHPQRRTRPSSARLPLGVGLTLGAAASVGLWTALAYGLRALFF